MSNPLPSNEDKEEPPTLITSATGAGLRPEASDEVLMPQLGGGSREALAILFRRYARTVRSIAYRAVRDASEVQSAISLDDRNEALNPPG